MRHALLHLLPVLAAAGGGSVWYTESYEYSFVEALALIVLVCLALFFEVAWHSITHLAEHSYRYGHLHDIADFGCPHESHGKDGQGNVRHVTLFKELANRASGEFMTLGFLAFCVFIFNQSGGFKVMAKASAQNSERRLGGDAGGSDVFHLPQTPEDWLHMIEIVHMKLFIGMVFYFFLMFVTIRGAVIRIFKWEGQRLRRLKIVQSKGIEQSNSLGHRVIDQSDPELVMYLQWRDYFIHRVVGWRHRRPHRHAVVLETLNLDPDAPDVQGQLKSHLEERFALSSYLAFNVETGLRDSIEVHHHTWIFILCLFGLMAVAARIGHLTLLSLTPYLITLQVFLLFMMWAFVKKRQARILRLATRTLARSSVLDQDGIQQIMSPDKSGNQTGTSKTSHSVGSHKSNPADDKKNIHEKYQTELIMMRLLQVVLFLISYVFAQTVADFHDWQTDPQSVALYTFFFLFLFAVLSLVLPNQVPLFLAVMALPPHIDDANLAVFLSMVDDHMNPIVKEELSVGSPHSQSLRQTPLGIVRHTPLLEGVPSNLVEAELQSLERHADTNSGSLKSMEHHLSRISSRMDEFEKTVAREEELQKIRENVSQKFEELEVRQRKIEWVCNTKENL